MISIDVRGEEGVHAMLRDYMEPILPRRMQDATKAGATVFKGPVKAEAARVSRRLARSVSVRKASRERPATVLTFRPKIAFFRHWIIGGTKDHGPRRAEALVFEGEHGIVRTKRVRGVKANPIIDRVAQRLEGQAYAAIDRALDRSEST